MKTKKFIDDNRFLAKSGKNFKLEKYETKYIGGLEKEEGKKHLKDYQERMHELQEIMYAYDKHSFLIVFQAMDAAGKDSTISHVFEGMFPQSCTVHSFKVPNQKELDHDFLWRSNLCLPERGRTSIFNRSYYEELLVVRVHKHLILNQNLPGIKSVDDITDSFWKDRIESITDLEKHLSRNGTIILKFFLNVSKEEQAERFLKRIRREDKHWKFNFRDVEERSHWDDYMKCYEEAIGKTHKKHAPWYIIPADNKWFMRYAVSRIIVEKLESLHLEYPEPNPEDLEQMDKAKDILEKANN